MGTTETLNRTYVYEWLLEHYLVKSPYGEALATCIAGQNLENLDAVIEHYRGMESGEEGHPSNDALGFVLSSLVECHEGPHTATCPDGVKAAARLEAEALEATYRSQDR